MQQFKTVDLLRLEIEDDPTGLINMVQNPAGALGGWGWITPVAGAYLNGTPTTVGEPVQALRYLPGVPGPHHYFYSEPMPITAGQYAAASWNVPQNGYVYRARFEWLDSSLSVLSSSTQTGYLDDVGAAYGPYQAPASTAYVRLRFDVYQNAAGDEAVPGSHLWLNEVTVAKSDVSGDLGLARTNLMPTPTFDYDAGAWSGGGIFSGVDSDLAYLLTDGSPAIYTGHIDVTAGETYTLSGDVAGYYSGTGTMRAVIEWRNSGGSVAATSNGAPVALIYNTYDRATVTAVAPSGAVSVRVRFERSTSGAEAVVLNRVLLENASTDGDYFDGDTPDIGSTVYAWTGTPGDSASTVASPDLPYIEPVPYLNILGPTHEIKVTREALNTGTLSATVLDATLDPSQSDLIRPGRRCRLLIEYDSDTFPIFTGKVSQAQVTYDYKTTGLLDAKRARIELTALDALADLTNTQRSEGVATIEELPYVLEGCGVPWLVNGSGNQVSAATVAAYNENVSAADQVAITRDTGLGYAWVNRDGQIEVRDAASLAGVALTRTAATDEYSDLDLSYDTQDCINEVVVNFLRYNPDTGQTEEVAYGPYRDEASIAEWGVRSATFTIQGIAEETADLADYADAILTANATPVVKVNAMTVPMRTATDVAYFGWTDLCYFEMAVQKPDESGYYASNYVTRIEHSITPEKWLTTFGFTDESRVAAPTFTPSPNTGAAGKTIGQLLRPVGEVTMWFGAEADVPNGWLACDGSAFSGSEYPELEDLLGGTTLPNFTDRFPIGAGTKALGASGGNNSITLGVGHLPSHNHDGSGLSTDIAGVHDHDIVRGTGTGTSAARVASSSAASTSSASTSSDGGHTHNVAGVTGSTGSGSAINIMNPWRALWFIIRAK